MCLNLKSDIFNVKMWSEWNLTGSFFKQTSVLHLQSECVHLISTRSIQPAGWEAKPKPGVRSTVLAKYVLLDGPFHSLELPDDMAAECLAIDRNIPVVWAYGVSWWPVLGVWLCWRAITSLTPACRCCHDEFCRQSVSSSFATIRQTLQNARTFSPLNAPLLHSGRKGRGPQLTSTALMMASDHWGLICVLV